MQAPHQPVTTWAARLLIRAVRACVWVSRVRGAGRWVRVRRALADAPRRQIYIYLHRSLVVVVAPHTLHSRARALARRHSARVPLTPTRTNLHGARTARTPTRPARTVASHTRIMGPDARHIKQPTTPGTAGHNARNCGTAVSGVVRPAPACAAHHRSPPPSHPVVGPEDASRDALPTLSRTPTYARSQTAAYPGRVHTNACQPRTALSHGGAPRGAPQPRNHDPACLPACQEHRTALIPCPRSVF